MAKAAFKVIKHPPRISKQQKIVRDEIRKGLKRAGKKGEQAWGEVTENWRHRVRFEASVGIGPKQLFVYILPRGSSFSLMLWKRISKKGARRRIMRPKGRSIKLFWGGPGSYSAKTTTAPSWGGSGRVRGGRIKHYKYVEFPGFRPRDFWKVINPDLQKDVDREIRNGVARGRRRIR